MTPIEEAIKLITKHNSIVDALNYAENQMPIFTMNDERQKFWYLVARYLKVLYIAEKNTPLECAKQLFKRYTPITAKEIIKVIRRHLDKDDTYGYWTDVISHLTILTNEKYSNR